MLDVNNRTFFLTLYFQYPLSDEEIVAHKNKDIKHSWKELGKQTNISHSLTSWFCFEILL